MSSDFERSGEEPAPVRCFRVRPRQFGGFRARVERRIYILNIYTNGKIVYIICPYISVLDQAQAQERVHNPMEDLVRYRKQSLSRSLGLLRTAKEEAHPPTFFVCLRPPQKSTEIHSIGSHGSPWVPIGPHVSPCHGVGSPWVPMGSPWLPWKIQECRKQWILMKTTIW